MSPSSRGRGRRAQPDPLVIALRRRRRRGRTKARHRRFARFVLGGVVGGLVFLAISGFTGAAVWMSSCDLKTLRPVQVGENSFVYAADGSLLGSIPAEKNRQPVSTAQIGAWVPKATVAIEDRRFWHHGALDWPGIVRALFADIRHGHVVQGGSSITQQLARNLYIKKPSQTFSRKATEACLAIKLAREKSKSWILNAYMNQIFYGNHAYGIEAASQTYFSKRAKNLTLDESALLAGLPQAPTRYDPFHNPQEAIGRRDEVLRAMLANDDITSTQYSAAVADRKLHLNPGQVYTRIREPYFFSYVEAQLQKHAVLQDRSGGCDRLHQSVERCHPRHDGGHAGQLEKPGELLVVCPPAARFDVQDAGARDGDLGRHQPGNDHVSLGSVRVQPDRAWLVQRQSADRLVSADLRPYVHRSDVD